MTTLCDCVWRGLGWGDVVFRYTRCAVKKARRREVILNDRLRGQGEERVGQSI